MRLQNHFRLCVVSASTKKCFPVEFSGHWHLRCGLLDMIVRCRRLLGIVEIKALQCCALVHNIHIITNILDISHVLCYMNYLTLYFFIMQKSDEQKLIYSGQLLNDATVLKDILRTYEGQVTHTVHLVCTPKHTSISAKSTQASNNTEAAQPAGLPADNIADGLR